MKRGTLATLLSILFIISILLAHAVFADRDGKGGGDNRQTAHGKVIQTAQDRLDAVKEKAVGRAQAAKEKLQGKKETAQEKVAERRENLGEKRAAAMENAKEKRDELKARVAAHDVQKVSALDRERLKEIAKLPPDQAKARLARLKIIKADENFKTRPVAEEKLRERKAAFERLKGQESTLKEEYEERLEQLKEKKEALKGCGNESSDDCNRKRGEAIEKAREAALKTADRLVAHLSKLKEKIQGSENMPDDEVAAKTAKIDAAIAEIETIKQKITAAATKEEFNAAVRELKQVAKKAKRASEMHSQGLLRAEINGVIHRAEVSEKKLDCALTGLEAQGIDTASVDARIAEFSSTLGSAREKLKQAKGLLESEDDAQIAEGKALVREAKELVQQGHRLLEEIRKEIRGLGGKPCEEKQDLVVEEEEDAAPAAPESTGATT